MVSDFWEGGTTGRFSLASKVKRDQRDSLFGPNIVASIKTPRPRSKMDYLNINKTNVESSPSPLILQEISVANMITKTFRNSKKRVSSLIYN